MRANMAGGGKILLLLLMLWTATMAGGVAGPRGPAGALARWLITPQQAPAAFTHRLTPAAEHGNQELPVPMVLGYYYSPQGDGSALDSLRAYRRLLTGIVPFWYTIHRDGSITGQADPSVLRLAERWHLLVFPLIQNMAGAPVYRRLLQDPLATARALDNILALVEQEGYDGVNLDMEAIAPEDREAFSRFVSRLAAILHAYGYYLTLSVPAETEDEPRNPWTGAYDYRALGRAADLVMIMAYDQHSVLSSPGSIASTGWVEQVVHYATRVIPPSKLILGIPAYGYDWQQGSPGAVALSYAQAVALADKYAGGDLAVNHFSFYRDGVLNQVWYENAATFAKKVSLAIGYNLRGIVLWRLGIEDPAIWRELGD